MEWNGKLILCIQKFIYSNEHMHECVWAHAHLYTHACASIYVCIRLAQYFVVFIHYPIYTYCIMLYAGQTVFIHRILSCLITKRSKGKYRLRWFCFKPPPPPPTLAHSLRILPLPPFPTSITYTNNTFAHVCVVQKVKNSQTTTFIIYALPFRCV